MRTHEYPDGYRVRILDEDITLDKVADFFEDTGPTGATAVAWIDRNQAVINTQFDIPLPMGNEARGYFEDKLKDDQESVERCQANYRGQALVSTYLDERRRNPEEPSTDEHISYADARMLTLARPDIQRLARHDQKRVLQHEVWTEAERLWMVDQALVARGYERDPERDNAYDHIDQNLQVLDGMSMGGMAQWSYPLQELRQRFTIANGSSDIIAMIDNTRRNLSMDEDIASMSIEELLELRDKKVWRINEEIAIYVRNGSAGTPMDTLYQQIRWTEAMLDFNFNVVDSGALVEQVQRNHLDTATATYTADIMHLLPIAPQLNNRYALSLNLSAVIRRSSQLEDNVSLFTSQRQAEYADLEAYLAALWEAGDELAKDADYRATVSHIGHAATVTSEQPYSFVR